MRLRTLLIPDGVTLLKELLLFINIANRFVSLHYYVVKKYQWCLCNNCVLDSYYSVYISRKTVQIFSVYIITLLGYELNSILIFSWNRGERQW